MSTHDKLDYVEFAAADISATKSVFLKRHLVGRLRIMDLIIQPFQTKDLTADFIAQS